MYHNCEKVKKLQNVLLDKLQIKFPECRFEDIPHLTYFDYYRKYKVILKEDIF